MISKIPSQIRCEFQNNLVKLTFNNLSTGWMRDDDSFIKRKKISFKIYFKSLFESKSVNSKKLILVRNIWKSKISEENIIFLSIQIESINKNLFNYNQFSILKNDDLLF